MFNRKRRWSDNQHTFGPLLWAVDKYGPHYGIILDSGREGSGCHLRLYLYRLTVICELPPLVWPHRRKVTPEWDAETIARLGRSYYYDETEREFGFCYSSNEGFLQVKYGRQGHNSSTEKSWCKHVPWKGMKFICQRLYDLEGKFFAVMPEHCRLGDTVFHSSWKARMAVEEACPKRHFLFKDYDGEEIVVTTKIEDRMWTYGTGSCSWFAWFRKPVIHRSLDLSFNKETGKKKGSWKGGTTGHSIAMLPDELHEAAFKRYCAEHAMTFISECGPPPPKQPEYTDTSYEHATVAKEA